MRAASKDGELGDEQEAAGTDGERAVTSTGTARPGARTPGARTPGARTLAARTHGTRTLAAGILVLAASAACSTPSSGKVSPAAEGGSPACSAALDTAPATVADRARTPLPVTGALSWGEPAIVLRCGLPEAAPTTKPCLGINGIDWIVEADSGPYVFVSYGRVPAVELRVPAGYSRETAVAAVTDVGPVAAALPRNGRVCVGQADAASPGGTGGTSSPGGPGGSAVSATRSGG